jgi:hypothetical protein
LKQKEKVCFSDFWHFSDNFAQHNTTRPLPKLKKHHPTNLYMLYPMAQSVVHILVEKIKKMTPQKHCPLSSFIITIIHFTVGEANKTLEHAYKKPYRHSTGAPHPYPHTLILR